MTAVLFATAAYDADRPLAALAWEDTTLAARLAGQLSALGVEDIHVVARPGGADALGLEGVELHESPAPADDLRLVAELARKAPDGAITLAYADIITQSEALAGVLGQPRVSTGVLISRRLYGRVHGIRVRTEANRVLAAVTAYHLVEHTDAVALGVIKVAPADRTTLAFTADRLARLLDGPLPHGWQKLADNRERRLGTAEEDEVEDEVAPRERRFAADREDVIALVLMGLARSGLFVAEVKLRQLFWSRPMTEAAVERAAERIDHYDEDRALLLSSVKTNDGFFTTFFVSPYSKYVARWAAHRGFTPNQVTVVSMLVGALAAAGFATGERWGLIAGAVLLQVAFMLDCVDGQLARYTRTFTDFGAWLDSIFDRAKEYLVFAGLAIGASRTGDPVWVLAGCALAFQTARHMLDFAIPVVRQRERSRKVQQIPLEKAVDREVSRGDVEETGPWPWIKKVAGFPIGERFAAISVVAAVSDAETTFIVLLVWGAIGMTYLVAGRLKR